MDILKKQITLKNNEIYHYIEQGNGDKTLVLVHGNLSSSVHYLPLLKSLPTDLKVYAVDLRGFGDSSYNNRIESLKDLAEDLKLFCDALSITSATFTGWSTGGGVVLELAAMYPKVVEKLILIESASHKGYPIFKKDENMKPLVGEAYKTKDEMGNDPVQVLPLVNALRDKSFDFMSWIWDKTIYNVNKPSPEDNKLYLSETLKQRNLLDIDWSLATLNMSNEKNTYVEGDNTIKDVKVPVLHIWSKNDIVVPFYLVNENVEALKDQSTLKIYEAGGHSPLIDNLELLTNDIVDFMNGV